jgi:Pentapeptide repeats (8 copies)
MADQLHLDILQQSVESWNSWRDRNPSIEPDLSQAYLSGAYLREAKLGGADLSQAHLNEAYLPGAGLSQAKLSLANLHKANLLGADLSEANLSRTYLAEAKLGEADLSRANLANVNLATAYLYEANLSEANLADANLSGSAWVNSDLTGATLTDCSIYGISAWNLKLDGAKQQNLNISEYGEPAVMVDNLEVAQFVYLLLNNEKIRDVIDTIGEKGVLILGRFTEERKRVLDAIRDRLRELGFVPMMFDFERPSQQDFDETIKTLAGLSRFIIADITNPKSNPLELQAIMPNYMVPFVPIIQEDEEPFAMFQGLQHKYGEWVLDVLEYDSAANLLEVLDEAVVSPALVKADQLILKKAEAIRKRHVKDYQ